MSIVKIRDIEYTNKLGYGVAKTPEIIAFAQSILRKSLGHEDFLQTDTKVQQLLYPKISERILPIIEVVRYVNETRHLIRCYIRIIGSDTPDLIRIFQ